MSNIYPVLSSYLGPASPLCSTTWTLQFEINLTVSLTGAAPKLRDQQN